MMKPQYFVFSALSLIVTMNVQAQLFQTHHYNSISSQKITSNPRLLDGELIASPNAELFLTRTHYNGTAYTYLYDAERVKVLGPQIGKTSFTFTSNGAQIYSCDSDRSLEIFDSQNFSSLKYLWPHFSTSCGNISVSTDTGEYISSTYHEFEVRKLDSDSLVGTASASLELLTLLPAGRILMGGEGAIEIRNISSISQPGLKVFSSSEIGNYSPRNHYEAISRNDRYMAVLNNSSPGFGTIYIHSLGGAELTGKIILDETLDRGPMAINSDGTLLVHLTPGSKTRGNILRVFDIRSGSLISKIQTSFENVYDIHFGLSDSKLYLLESSSSGVFVNTYSD